MLPVGFCTTLPHWSVGDMIMITRMTQDNALSTIWTLKVFIISKARTGSSTQHWSMFVCFQGNTTVQTIQMSEKRNSPSSTVIFSGESEALWVAGGYYPDWGPSPTSEIVSPSGIEPGPNLPKAVYSHCMVTLNSWHAMMIAGYGKCATLCPNHLIRKCYEYHQMNKAFHLSDITW